MARPLRVHLPGIPCHIVSRGNNKQRVFEDDADYEQFLRLLARTLQRFEIECAAYCLMWNHFHLLLVPRELPIARAMQQLNSTYCQWFNRRHGRVGHVLQGRYTARIVDKDSYLRNVLRYIARNPVEAALAANPADWRWSSYRALAGLTAPDSFLSPHHAWRTFDEVDADLGRRRFVAFVAADPKEDEEFEPALELDSPVGARLERFLEPHRQVREFTYADRFAVRPTVEQIVAGAETYEHLREAAGMAFRRYGYTLQEIGQAVGRSPSTVWLWIHRSDRVRPRRRKRNCGVRSRFFERGQSGDRKIEI